MATAERPATQQQEPARSWRDIPLPAAPIDIVAIGASAGGVEALRTVVAELPGHLPAAVFVVLHIAQTGTSMLPEILDRAGPLPALAASEGQPIVPGHIWVAPSNRHLLLEDGVMRLSLGSRESKYRPAVDRLFASAAETYGPRVAGVVLSGALDDGSEGLGHVKRLGGIAIVQDPDTAAYPSMPRTALGNVAVDAVLPLTEIGPALARLSGSAEIRLVAPRGPPAEARPRARVIMHASHFTCPDCGGALTEFDEGGVPRFRCAVGHSYSLESLVDVQADQFEAALWVAVRTLEDRALLLRRMESSNRDAGNLRNAAAFDARAREVISQAEVVRDAIERASSPRPGSPPVDDATPL